MHANITVWQAKIVYSAGKYTSDRLILVTQQRAIGERQSRFLLIMANEKEPR